MSWPSAWPPWLATALSQLGTHNAANIWMAAWWKGRGGLWLGPAITLAALANGTGGTLHLQVPLPTFPSSLTALRWASWAVGAVGLTGAAFVALGFRGPPRDRATPDRTAAGPRGTQRDLLIGAGLFAAIPLLGLVLISLLAGPAYVVGRTDTLALPGLAILLGIGWAYGFPRPHRGVSGLRGLRRQQGAHQPGRPLLATIALTAWIILGVIALAPSWRGDGRAAKGSDRELATLLASQIEPGDAVVFSALSRPTLEYYARRLGWWDRAGWKGSFPASFDRNAAGSWPTPLDSAAVWREQAIDLRREWERGGTGTVWLLAFRDPLASAAPVPNTAPSGSMAGGATPVGAVETPWPSRPAPPPSTRSRRGAAQFAYPANVLMSVLTGLDPAQVAWEYRQDWVAGDRVVLRLPRSSWVPLDSIPSLETRP